MPIRVHEDESVLLTATVEQLANTVHLCKEELMRRGLDECGLEMPILHAQKRLEAKHLTPTDKARAMMDEHMELVGVPLRAHHQCQCPRNRAMHLPDCPVAKQIKNVARQDVELEQAYRDVVEKIGKVTVEALDGSSIHWPQDDDRTVLIRIKGGQVDVEAL